MVTPDATPDDGRDVDRALVAAVVVFGLVTAAALIPALSVLTPATDGGIRVEATGPSPASRRVTCRCPAPSSR
jgi:hypothetical protein